MRIEKQQATERSIRDQAAQAQVAQREEAEQRRIERVRAFEPVHRMARELARRAVAQHVWVNRSWVTEYGKWDSLYRRLFLSGKVLVQGWMILHEDEQESVSDGSTCLSGRELVLMTGGVLVHTSAPHSSKMNNMRDSYVHKIRHPKPQEYLRDMMRTASYIIPPNQTPGTLAISPEEVTEGLAEFAGLNKLV